ncbi:MAG: MazG nucleotide pyrophosphohydrolase domain-containing protein [Candidatus Nanohaloarchaea archaeon]
MREQQEEVAEFIEENELGGTTPFRIMDLVSEVGEIVKDATKTADYGQSPEDLEVKEEEIGDAMFSLLAVSEDLGIDSEEALEKAMEKYRRRIEEKGEAGSGSHS